MSKQLIKRLRDYDSYGYEGAHELVNEAADRIEELTQELQALKQIMLTVSMRLSTVLEEDNERDY